MKANLITLSLLAILSFFVTNANAGGCTTFPDGSTSGCEGVSGDPTTFAPPPWPSVPNLDGLVLPPLGTQISSPTEQPTSQHLELVAQAEARAKESARQWWINFFNK